MNVIMWAAYNAELTGGQAIGVERKVGRNGQLKTHTFTLNIH